jgi:hypothetical protein
MIPFWIFVAVLVVAGVVGGLLGARSVGWHHPSQILGAVLFGAVFGLAVLMLVFAATLLGVRLLHKRSPLAKR